MPPRGQRRGQVDADQDALGRVRAERGRLPLRRRGDPPQVPARRPRARDRHRLPGPGDDPAAVDLEELLPRLGADEGLGSVPSVRREEGEGDHARRAVEDGHRHPRSGAARRDALGWRAAVGRDRPRRVLRRAGADPRRADRGARREAGGRRPPLHRDGEATRRGRRLHHPQPAPRVPRRRPLRDPPAREGLRELPEGRAHARAARADDGRRSGAREPRARAPAGGGRRRRAPEGGRRCWSKR